ncbi:MAG: FG-GAP repeat domain-containing protein [Phycisphaerales bacterium]
MRTPRIGRWLLALVTWCGAAPALARQAEFCLPDSGRDGHPMFGNTQIRPFPEVENGVHYAGRCTTVAFADLDGDGDADAVVGDVGTTAPVQLFISVLFNSGDGVFQPGALYAAGRLPCAVELGDFDGDLDVDIATTDEIDNTVSILFNAGDGTFAPRVTYPVGQRPRSLKIADLDGDLDLDLVVLNTVSHDVSILLNHGDGTFAPEVRVFVGNVTQRGEPNMNFQYPGPFLAVGDLDGDGDIDIAVPSRSRVKLLLNDGAGNFALAAEHPLVTFPDAYAVVIADLDGDLDMDLAATSHHGGVFGPEVLSVLLNLGDATFAPVVGYNAGWVPGGGFGEVQKATSLTAGDIDADGDIDLAVGHGSGSNVILMRNRGPGTFQPAEYLPVGFIGNWFVRFAELNGDSRVDLAALCWNVRSTLNVLLNNGAGSVTTYAKYPREWECCVGEGWNWLEGADLDGDENIDLVAALQGGQSPHQVKVLLNDGKGAFDDITGYALGPQGASTGETVAIGDLNGDKVPDLVVCDAIVQGGFNFPGKVWTMMGRGDGTFEPATPYPFTGLIPKHAVIADLNGDRANDLAIWSVALYPGNDLLPADRRVVVCWNQGSGRFKAGPQLVIGSPTWPFAKGAVAALDLDGNGFLDIVGTAGTRTVPGYLRTFLNDGRGNFSAGQLLTTPPQPQSLMARPASPDSPPALLLMHNHNFSEGVIDEPYLSVWWNRTPGLIEVGPQYVDARLLTDGRLDALRTSGSGGTTAFVASVYQDVAARPIGDVALGSIAAHHGTGYWPTAVVLADFDGDGRLDLATSNYSNKNVSVLLNRACGTCYGDCDGDGVPTLADFACFQVKYLRADPWADCNHDARLSVADFGCFQNRFVAACP